MSVKKILKHALGTILLNAAILIGAHAGGSSTGAVTSVYTTAYGQVFISTASVTSAPSCAASGWIIDMSATAATNGKALMATLMWGQSMGKQITIVGAGNCGVWSDRETVAGVIVN